MSYSDCHAHLDLFSVEERERMLRDCKEEGIELVVSASVDYQSSCKNLKLSQDYEKIVRVGVGIHPWSVDEVSEDEVRKVLSLVEHDLVDVISEVGLDYKWNLEAKDKQTALFRKFLELGEKTGKPLIIHVHDAFDDMIKIVNEYPDAFGAVHCFNGTIDQALELYELGFYTSVSNALLSESFPDLQEVVKELSLEKMVVDTDALPGTYEVRHAIDIIKVISQVKNKDVKQVGKTITGNLKSIIEKN